MVQLVWHVFCTLKDLWPFCLVIMTVAHEKPPNFRVGPLNLVIVMELAARYFIIKALHGTAPTYISDLISVRQHKRCLVYSGASTVLLFPQGKICTFGDWALNMAAPGTCFQSNCAIYHLWRLLNLTWKCTFLNLLFSFLETYFKNKLIILSL